MNIKRGNLIYVDLGEHPNENNSRQSGVRPCLVVSNPKSKMLNVCPCTSKEDKKHNPVHVKVTAKDVKGYPIKPSVILVEQIVPVDRRLVVSKIGYIQNQKVLEQVNRALLVQLDLVKEDECNGATK